MLRWSDLELATGELNLRRSIALVGGKPVEKNTKGHQSRRIAIDPATVAALEMHRARLAEGGLPAGAHQLSCVTKEPTSASSRRSRRRSSTQDGLLLRGRGERLGQRVTAQR